jgi:hypothetical protein
MLELRAAFRNVFHALLAKFATAGQIQTHQCFTGTYILQPSAVKLKIPLETEMSK